MNAKLTPLIRRQPGFSLVELMVGMVVAMIGMIVIMQVYSVFEGQKRSTTSGGDAQTNGALALYMMEREVRTAGNGMTEGEPQQYPPLAGCTTQVYDAGGSYLMPNTVYPFVSDIVTAGTVSTIRLAPALISDGGGGRPDALTIAYGTTTIAAPYRLSDAGYTPGNPAITLVTGSGISRGDMVALVERPPAPADPMVPATVCSLLQVTAPPVSVPSAGTSVPVAVGRYNRAGGVGPAAYSKDTSLFNLGRLSLVTYRIDANRDLVADITQFGVIPDGGAGTAVSNRTDRSPVASNIVNMQFQYGVDTGNPMGAIQAACLARNPDAVLQAVDPDAIVDDWVEATGARWRNDPGAGLPTLLDMRRVRAVRVGLVARSVIKERDTGTGCDTTTTAPVIRWEAGPSMTFDLTGDPDWQCYRYKTFQAIIPVRNALWSSTMNPVSAASCGFRNP